MALHRAPILQAMVALCCATMPTHASTDDTGPSAEALAQFRQEACIRFTSASTAELSWETHHPSSATVLCGEQRQTPDRHESPGPALRHRVALTDLAPQRVYSYQIVMTIDGKEHRSETYQFDTTFNYAVASVAESREDGAPPAAKVAAILDAADTRKGYCLLAGTAAHELARELARQSQLIVILLEEDPQQAAASRRWLYDRGLHGSRVTVQMIEARNRLPLRGNFANLVVVDTSPCDVDELMRVLRPGSTAVFTENARAALATQRSKVERAGDLSLVRKELPQGIGEWTHQYGTASNRASCGETLAGARGTADLEIQWLGLPGGDFGLDRNPRMPAPLSTGGRLFHQGMNRIVALDAYNGAVLWNLEIPSLRRVNIPRDCGNWCAGGDRLYCAVSNHLWQIDPPTGRVLQSLQLPEPIRPTDPERPNHDWGYVAYGAGLIYGSSVKTGGIYTEFWGGARWYDKQDLSATSMVCSDSLFALHPNDGRPAWIYRGGTIVNPTITIDHGRVYFAESRHADAAQADARRVAGEVLWKDLYLVALDAAGGRKVWQRKLDIVQAKVVFFGQADPAGVVLVSSADNMYHLYRFNPDDGAPIWHAEHRWPSNNHSGHMQHPVIVGPAIYLEPTGYSLADGKVIAPKIGGREGCHTYLASSRALIYRGRGRRASMWSLDDGSVTSWAGLRPSCWLSMVPAGGMLLVPEAGGGCSCGVWLETSIGFAPWEIGLTEDNKPGDNGQEEGQ